MLATPYGKIFGLVGLLALAGCSATPPTPEPEPAGSEAAPPADDGGDWSLDESGRMTITS